ncbi:GntR family transcriptional regulator [Yinghuangia sp. ASG 101]|uniref:GntR family transcriptional regulator n=1 Tax=Yinghuangia sp. ASG 101 TaxID=2896848 RepID=UPI001E2B478C|nr:GntR family transcriptional regulator [Yinghuangia sp. ASG 101]UGQ15130.1 GntR family transcriptional regulator [Yinghuangia sp. ASG 101]
MPYEVPQPKYVRLVQALQAQIEDGTYPPGSMLPSEHQLVAAFSMSRPTVVRALQILRHDGWIESQQGRGTFVRGRPAATEPVAHSRRGLDVVTRAEDSSPGELIAATAVKLPKHIAAVLGVPSGAKALLRRWIARDEDGPTELVSSYFPLELVDRTDLASAHPLAGGLLKHLEERGVVIDRITERICARAATDEETELLELPAGVPVLGLVVTSSDASGRAWHVAEVAMPGDRGELEDSYSVR